VILNFGLGKRGLLHRRPHHGARAAIQKPVHREFVQLAHDLGFGGERHRGVGVHPIAHAAEPLELFALHADPVRGEGAALVAQFAHRDFVFAFALGAVLLLDLPFDGEAVTVPARHVRRVEPEHLARAHHEILQDLVERGPDMDVAIGIRRAVMQHEQRPALGLGAQAGVKTDLLPALQPFRLRFGQARLHGKAGGGQEQGGAVVALFRICGVLIGHSGHYGGRGG